jgi:hypothetical protein
MPEAELLECSRSSWTVMDCQAGSLYTPSEQVTSRILSLGAYRILPEHGPGQTY